MAFMTFHILGIIIIPTDEVIFFRGVGQPPTSKMFGEKSPTPHRWFTPPVQAIDKRVN